MSFKRLLSLACLFGFFFSLNGAMNQYLVFDHQVYNFFMEQCKLDVQGKWNDIFEYSTLEKTKKLTKKERDKLFELKGEISQALHKFYSTLPVDDQFILSQKSLEELIGPKVPNQNSVTQDMLQQIEAEQLGINETMVGQFFNNKRLKRHSEVRLLSCDKLTRQAFLENFMAIVEKFFDPKNILIRLKKASKEALQLRDKAEGDDEAEVFNFIKEPPVIIIGVFEDTENQNITLWAFPAVSHPNLDSSGDLYQEFKKPRSWAKTLCYAALAGLAVSTGAWAYNNWGNLSNQCGNDVAAGPGCTRPWEIRCQGKDCGPENIGPDDASWLVVGNCLEEGDNCLTVGYQSIALVGGRDVNGVAHCSINKPLPADLAFIGQIAPGAWECPVGKSPFHFLKDGRLCFYTTPIIRAGVDAAVCDTAVPYCKLPGGLMLFRHGEDMLLTPPCGQGTKICNVGDLKLYLHEDGKYTESSPCDPVETDGVCVFDENLIEFYNPQTQLWQNKPVDWTDNRMLYRFKDGNLKVFCTKDGSCTIKFPCDLKDGKCPVDSTVFYSKKGSQIWTEGMPCGAQEEYCIIENNQVFYPHKSSTDEGVKWKEVPAWTGEPTKGIYTGPDGKIFIPSLNCVAWEPLPEDKCFTSQNGLYCVYKDGQARYWHANKDGECGWFDAPACTGNESDGICTGPDGQVFILNDDLTAWVPMPAECLSETSLFCVKDGVVRYWHKGQDGKAGSWKNAPSCEEYADKDFCIGPDRNVFTRSGKDLNSNFELLKPPYDQTISSLVRLKNCNFVVWHPEEKMWKINEAPCTNINHTKGYCTLGDGNELYSVTINGKRVWSLKPDVPNSVNKIRFTDGARRWRQVPIKSVEWTPVMPCLGKDACSMVVTKEQFEKLNTTNGYVLIQDEEECEICPFDTVKTYRPLSLITNIKTSNE